jgi:hypothetical protein
MLLMGESIVIIKAAVVECANLGRAWEADHEDVAFASNGSDRDRVVEIAVYIAIEDWWGVIGWVGKSVGAGALVTVEDTESEREASEPYHDADLVAETSFQYTKGWRSSSLIKLRRLLRIEPDVLRVLVPAYRSSDTFNTRLLPCIRYVSKHNVYRRQAVCKLNGFS